MLPQVRGPGDLDPLLALLPEAAEVAEIGVFAGDASRQFLACSKVRRLYCVDIWRGGYDPDDQASNADMGEAEQVFDQLLIDPRAVKLRCDTSEAPGLISGQLDLVYLDADHRYDAVRADILRWICKVKHGGLLAGHDYTDSIHVGVRQAVDEIFGAPDYVFPDSSWVVRLPAVRREFTP